MPKNLETWINLVLTARQEIIERWNKTGIKPGQPDINHRQAKEAIDRAAASLLEYEHASGVSVVETNKDGESCVI